jgi:hypothetical protein
MASSKAGRVYHRLVIEADPETVIWLVDDSWHLVEKAIGTLDTRVLPGRYYIEMDESGVRGVAYPVELISDLHLTKDMLEAGPACERQAPMLLDE